MTTPNTSASPDATLHHRLLAFGELRDAVLFLATATYVFGYVTWAIYSADQGIGVPPPLEGQYFLSGILPVLLILGVPYLLSKAPATREDKRKSAGRWGNRILSGASVAIVMLMLVQIGIQVPELIVRACFVAGVFAIYVGLACTLRSGEKGSGWILWLFRLAVPLAVVSTFLLYATRVFPVIPREFGGPRPSCVEFDISGGTLSPATAQLLGIDSRFIRGTVRSGPIWLHFEGGGTLIVSQRKGRPISSPFRMRDAKVNVVLASKQCQ